jgi:hypothetical protein
LLVPEPVVLPEPVPEPVPELVPELVLPARPAYPVPQFSARSRSRQRSPKKQWQ